MRLHELKIQNMRLFGTPAKHIKFADKKNITIFLGNNGSGKTTIMDSIINLLSAFMGEFPGSSIMQFSEADVHKVDKIHISDSLTVEADIETEDGKITHVIRSRKGYTDPQISTDLRGLKEYASSIISRTNNNEQVEYPVIAYYGTGRGFFQMPERRRNFTDTFERWDTYIGAPQPNTDFKRFINWFDIQEDDERREKIDRNDTSYQSASLSVVKSALSRFIGRRCSNPRILNKPLRFVVDETLDDGTVRELRLEEMSDGYKIIIAMVADIASRMVEANPVTDECPMPLNASGIILIDEIDLHLHPKWQREILKQLSTTFPNIQFIVTTHSPIIVVGAANIAQIIKLNDDTTDNNFLNDLSVSNIGQVLLSDLFGLKSLQSPLWDDKIQERDTLLSKDELSPEDEARLAQLDEEMKGLTSLQDSNAIRSTRILEKLAIQLGIEI